MADECSNPDCDNWCYWADSDYVSRNKKGPKGLCCVCAIKAGIQHFEGCCACQEKVLAYVKHISRVIPLTKFMFYLGFKIVHFYHWKIPA